MLDGVYASSRNNIFIYIKISEFDQLISKAAITKLERLKTWRSVMIDP